jgi:hypothetical protein
MNDTARITFAAICVLMFLGASGQEAYREWFSYLSPRPDAQFIMPEQKITFRLQQSDADREALMKTIVDLTGSVSGPIQGTLEVASDGRTLIFSPSGTFAHGETVAVSIGFAESLDIPDFTMHFTTTTLPATQRRKILEGLREEEIAAEDQAMAEHPAEKSLFTTNDSLPEGFPEISIVKWDDPSEGYIFVSPLHYEANTFFLIILDNYATPVYYREVPANGATDFKLQPNGTLTSYSTPEWKYLVQDAQFNFIDTIAAQNGYDADLHELLYYADGHSFLMCYDPQLVDMSQVVTGGQPDAVVTGLIVQELDENQDLVFQWRSWDHYQITDASNWVDLTESSIDYVHGNSIEIVNTDEMMICSRNMNEITKLDRNTGEIIWRLNGENNMFEFIPPADSFCMQHSIRLMPNSSNISIFDNGNCWVPAHSSAVEYILDEENFTATLVERLRSQPDIFGAYMGNTQRLENGHTINGWGKGVPSVTEFDANGNIVLEFSFPQLNYRAFKFDWHHEAFHADVEDIDFGMIDYQDSAIATITLSNTYGLDIAVNRVVNHTYPFTVINALPITLPANGTAEVEVMFKPGNSESFEDVMTFCWEIHSDTLRQRVGVQVGLTGSATGNEGVSDLEAGGFRVFPSPFKRKLSIRSEEKFMKSVSIMTLRGKVAFKEEGLQTRHLYLQPGLSSGTYFIAIETEDGEQFTGKIICR